MSHDENKLAHSDIIDHSKASSRVAETQRDIGEKLRAARNGAGLTLGELARRTNLSQSFLSKLERGQASSSIANLIEISDVLGLSLSDVFSGSPRPLRSTVSVHRATELPKDHWAATGYKWRLLGGGAALDKLEVFHLVFPLKEKMKTMISHHGQEHCYVLSGEIVFFVNDARYHLKQGDGIYIDSRIPHRAENFGDTEAHVLMTVSKNPENNFTDWWRPELDPNQS